MDISNAASGLAKLGPIAAVSVVGFALAAYSIFSASQVETAILQNNTTAVQALQTASVDAQSEARSFRDEMRRHWDRSEQIHQRMTSLLTVICAELSNGTATACYSERAAD